MKKHPGLIPLLIIPLFFYISNQAQTSSTNSLLENFISPPNSAKPRVWWHWMNGNITEAGIRKDLEWMKRSGIGGMHNFDAALATPQIVDKRLTYMTPEWKDAFRFAARLADSLQLELAIAGSPGWSESGGPWVTAKDGMKKLVWSETRVQGNKPFAGQLALPPATTGTFQNLPLVVSVGLAVESAPPPEYYQDITVIAYKLPGADIPVSQLNPKISSSGGNFNLVQLTDGDLATTTLLPSDAQHGYAWIQFEFERPQVIKAITVVGGGDKGPFGLNGELKDTRALEVSEDGENFHRITYIPAGNNLQQTITFPVSTAKFFRVTFKNPPAPFSFGAMLGAGGGPPKAPAGTGIAEIVLHTATRINRFEEKAAFAVGTDLYAQQTPHTDDVIAPSDVIDLSGKMQTNGTLNWTPPTAGTWNIVRFGFSLTGKQNHPASKEATGLEVDKLDPAAVKAYFTNYIDQYKNAANGLIGDKGGLQYMVTDSWEAGVQNWSSNLREEFLKRRGYALFTWMPVLTGHIIKSSAASDRFLWDLRKTLSEMLAEYHYDQLTTLLHQRGMKRYSESHESGRALIADGMDVKRKADIPMSAMWTPGAVGGDGTGYKADIRESASVAHIYGQNLVAAESLTAIGNAWSYSPERLKPTADLELANGLNRFVIHTSVHQPADDKIPGLGLGPFGQWFTRHETWAEQAKAWTDYLARSSFMLQQGKFVADIIYYYGEDNNITSLFGKKLPGIPEGYNYDFLNADALLNQLTVKNGHLVTPAGMEYQLLVLDSNSRYMSLKVAKKISELVKAGAMVAGPKPLSTTGLMDDDNAFQKIIHELWGEDTPVKTTGRGKVFTAQSLQKVLEALTIAPDFTYSKSKANTQLLYVHRKLPEQEVYWINNRNNQAEDIEASFRIKGKSAEIWHPETGKTKPSSYTFSNGLTKVPLHLEPNDAVFVVFRENTGIASVTIPTLKETPLMILEGSWKLNFQKDRGAPEAIIIDNLQSWTENNDAGVKYFSGTATYTKSINAPANWFEKDAQFWLNLGDVKDLAEIFINDQPLGIVWKKPFRVDITNALKPGDNKLKVQVTNLWVNRLIGDQQPDTGTKITYTTMAFYKAGSPLLPSGLLGPVTLMKISK